MRQQVTTNMLIGYNLRRAREEADLTQAQAAELLSPHLPTEWTRVTLSAAERSIAGTRVRQFTGDEIAAFSVGFGLPVSYFFMPPDPDDDLDDDIEISDADVQKALLSVAGAEEHQAAIHTRVRRLLKHFHDQDGQVPSFILRLGFSLAPSGGSLTRLVEAQKLAQEIDSVIHEIRVVEEERLASYAEGEGR